MSGHKARLALNRAASLLEAGLPMSVVSKNLSVEPFDATLSGEIQTLIRLSSETGAPLANGLKFLATKSGLISAAENDVKSAITVPRVTAKLLAWLPFLSVLVNLSLGLLSFEALIRYPAVLIPIALGSFLLFAASLITKKMANRAMLRPPSRLETLIAAELLLQSGLPHNQVLMRLPSLGSLGQQAHDAVDMVREAFELADRWGASPLKVIHAQTLAGLEEFAFEANQSAQKLSVRALLPLGLLGLPGFLLLVLAPVLANLMVNQ
ncbi:MAG: hypothetical protein RIR16_714 [Actinomycetota bacterium]|jgi:tight adherence protein B